MKQMTFAEINDLENGQQIPSLTGRVKKVFDQLTGEGQYGIWWLQSFILTDVHGVELKCTWSCEDTINELEGKEISIESGRDKKDQLAGIKKEIKNKNGKRYETVKLDDRCTIRKVEAQADPPKPGSSGEPSQDLGYDESEPRALFRHDKTANGGVDEARKHLMQSANLYNLCVACVDKAIAPNMPAIAQTSEQFQAAVGTLFIEASRAGLVAKMPTTPVHNGKISTTAEPSTNVILSGESWTATCQMTYDDALAKVKE